MSGIDELIQDLCPDGVPMLTLGELLDYEQPGKYLVSSTDYRDDHPTPVLTAGQTFVLGYTNETEGIYPASDDSPVLIFDDFTTAFRWVDFPFKAKSSAMKMLTLRPEAPALIRFVYFAMQCIGFDPQDHARHWIGKYSDFRIPVPPLEVQREIVRVLDIFIQLEAELEAELTARRAQYEYYRAGLLQFDFDQVESVALSEGFETRNGYTPAKSDPTNWANGTVPWFRMEDIRENGRVLDSAFQMISENAVKGGRYFPANSLIFATSATIGEHALITVPFISNQRFTAVWPKLEYSDRFDMKFLFYYGFVIDEWCRSNTTTSSFASVDMTGFKHLRIPIPPIEQQNRIAEQLDQFDALVNDISIGLPAELAARRKQYEHYRNRLLTFKELTA